MCDFRLLSDENAVVVDASRMSEYLVSLVARRVSRFSTVVVSFACSASEFQGFVVEISFAAGQSGMSMIVASHQEILSLLGSYRTLARLRMIIVALQRDADRGYGSVRMGEDGTGGRRFLSSKRKLQSVAHFIPMVPIG